MLDTEKSTYYRKENNKCKRNTYVGHRILFTIKKKKKANEGEKRKERTVKTGKNGG